ncbi:hypothetical protein BH11BAC3_BH11BAC3_26510 [soil metagenome]
MKISIDKKRLGYDLVMDRILTLFDFLPELKEEYDKIACNDADEDPDNQNPQIIFTIEDQIVSYYSTAMQLLTKGRSLSLLVWQDFESFVAEWLLHKDWAVHTKTILQNGGINIKTYKTQEGQEIKYIWITKKYSVTRRVGVKVVRELDYLISKSGATKGVIVTTSTLTKGAKKMIEEHRYRMFYIDNEMLLRDLGF